MRKSSVFSALVAFGVVAGCGTFLAEPESTGLPSRDGGTDPDGAAAGDGSSGGPGDDGSVRESKRCDPFSAPRYCEDFAMRNDAQSVTLRRTARSTWRGAQRRRAI